ncbi:MAG: SpoIIE family protein phosphatase [Lachnospiraceae bacterium]|nr:SpoIIE family protein phosphatase [Lachnospiraceae bacterium]
MKQKQDGKNKRMKPAKNAIARRIFRILLGTVIVLSILFTSINVVYIVRASRMTGGQIEDLTNHVYNQIMQPLIEEKDQSVLNLTSGNAMSINRFFDGCINTVQMVTQIASRIYRDDAGGNGYVVPLASASVEAQEPIYRLNASYFDEEDPEDTHTLEVMSRLRHILSSVYRMDGDICSVYFASTEGFTLFADEKQTKVLDEKGKPKAFDPDTRDWYKDAVAAGDVVCGSLKTDYFTNEPMLTISSPVYADEGKKELIGVVAVDVLIDTVGEILDATQSGFAQICIVNAAGDVQISTSESGFFGLEPNQTNNIYQDTVPTVKQTLDEAATGKSGFELIRMADGRELTRDEMYVTVNAETEEVEVREDVDAYKIYYSPIPVLNWSYLYIAEVYPLTARITNIMTDFFEKGETQRAANQTAMIISLLIVLGVMAGILGVMYLVSVRLSNNVTKPIVALTKKVRQINGDNLEFSWDMKADEETETLADSFGTMTQKIKEYIRDLTIVTAEKERIGAELDVARRIQADMLPVNFPEREELELYASMTPAKEVGGDFYDFFEIDEDRIALVIADVSGKGVPAALFMVIAKTLIKNCAMTGTESPKEIFAAANQLLCEGNDEMLFVTAWIGILTLSTGEMVCANAGHEYPVLKKADGEFKLYKDHHDVPLAAVETAKFREYTLKLDPGDKLFVYTDGFPEAMNEANEQFSEERVIDAMNEEDLGSPKELDERVRQRVKEFIGEASQFDDMTALGIHYFGPSTKG